MVDVDDNTGMAFLSRPDSPAVPPFTPSSIHGRPACPESPMATISPQSMNLDALIGVRQTNSITVGTILIQCDIT